MSFCKFLSISLAKQRKIYKKFLYALLRSATVQRKWTLVAQTKVKLKAIIRFKVDGLVVRSRQHQNAEEEVASIYHQKKVKKGDIQKLRVPQVGPVMEGEQEQLEVTEDLFRIEENLTNFFDGLLNRRLVQGSEGYRLPVPT